MSTPSDVPFVHTSKGDVWNQLLVQDSIEGAYHLEAFLLKWQFSMLQVGRDSVGRTKILGENIFNL